MHQLESNPSNIASRAKRNTSTATSDKRNTTAAPKIEQLQQECFNPTSQQTWPWKAKGKRHTLIGRAFLTFGKGLGLEGSAQPLGARAYIDSTGIS